MTLLTLVSFTMFAVKLEMGRLVREICYSPDERWPRRPTGHPSGLWGGGVQGREGPDTVSATLFPHTLHWALEFLITTKEILRVRVISFLSLSYTVNGAEVHVSD